LIWHWTRKSVTDGASVTARVDVADAKAAVNVAAKAATAAGAGGNLPPSSAPNTALHNSAAPHNLR
jgi:hypothetical protein